MRSWWYNAAVLVFWLVSMGWLLTTKVVPPLLTGSAPSYRDLLPTDVGESPPVYWTIVWNQQPLGWARNRFTRRGDGTGAIESEIAFEDLPVADLLDQLLGALGKFLRTARIAGVVKIASPTQFVERMRILLILLNWQRIDSVNITS